MVMMENWTSWVAAIGKPMDSNEAVSRRQGAQRPDICDVTSVVMVFRDNRGCAERRDGVITSGVAKTKLLFNNAHHYRGECCARAACDLSWRMG